MKALIAGIWLIAVAILVALAVLDLTVGDADLSAMADEGFFIGLAFVLIGLVGALAAMGQPRNAVGWLLLFSGTTIVWAGLAETRLDHLLRMGDLPRAQIVGWLGGLGWYTGLGLLFLIFPFLYPDGRLTGPRWRPVFAAAILVFAAILALMLLGPLLLPTRFELPPIESLTGPLFWGVPLVVLLGVTSLVVRYRQAIGDVRLQMKWLLITIGGPLVSFAAVATLEEWLAAEVGFSNLLWGLLYLLIPLGLGIALLRYRMFDVDTVIRKTAIYGVLTALLALVYFGGVVVLQSVLTPLTGDSDAAVVLSTLLIAALFLPLRRRVQGGIDRRFYRRKYNAGQVLARFAAAARDETDLDALTAELVRVIQETMEPEHVSVWLKPTTDYSKKV